MENAKIQVRREREEILREVDRKEKAKEISENEKFRQKNEKSYTLDLLFGDIFYSRAVVYFMEYGDFLVFKCILNSLKQAHKSKLLFHLQLVEAINKKVYLDLTVEVDPHWQEIYY